MPQVTEGVIVREGSDLQPSSAAAVKLITVSRPPARAAQWRPVVVGGGCLWLLAAVSVLVVAWRPGDGFDLTDEASYLLAADPPHPGDAFNGLSGFYLRPLWLLSDWNVGGVRLIGLAALVGVAIALGLAVAPFLHRRGMLAVPVTVAGAVSYYGLGLRTPSYNLLALIGVMLGCAATLRLMEGRSARWAGAAALGVAVAATGKLTSAVALALVLAVPAGRRPAARWWALGTLATAVSVHLAFVLSAGQTLTTLERSSAMLAVVDPAHYTVAAGLSSLLFGTLALAVRALASGGLFGALGLASLPGRRQAIAYTVLSSLSVIGASAVALLQGGWGGGVGRWLFGGGGVTPIVLAIALAVLAGKTLRLPAPQVRRPLAAAGLLVAGSACYVFGSNLGPSVQVNGAAGLLGPAAILLCAALPLTARTVTTATVAGCLCVGAAVTSAEAYLNPYRSAPIAASTTPIHLGPSTVRVDAAMAQQLLALEAQARADGWRPGTPLIDTTFSPGVALALHADVPAVLLPGFPGYPVASVAQALRGEGSRWLGAWLILSDGDPLERRQALVSQLGRTYPNDFRAVGALDDPWAKQTLELYAPVTGAAGP